MHCLLACRKSFTNALSPGIQIEEPFHVLPMDAYCSMMSSHAKEQFNRRKGQSQRFQHAS